MFLKVKIRLFHSERFVSVYNLVFIIEISRQLLKVTHTGPFNLQCNGPQDFDYFNCHGRQTFILYEIRYYLCPPKSSHNNSFLGSVDILAPFPIHCWKFPMSLQGLEDILSYHIVSYQKVSHHIISYYILSHHIISYRIVSYRFISYRITSHRIVTYHIIIESYHITSHRITPYHIILNV